MTEASLHTFKGLREDEASEDEMSIRSMPSVTNTCSAKNVTKKKTTARSTAKLTDLLSLEEKLSGKINEKFTSLESKMEKICDFFTDNMANVATSGGNGVEENGVSDTRRPNTTHTIQANSNLGARLPLIEVNNSLDAEFGLPTHNLDDVLSLQPGQEERHATLGSDFGSDNEQSVQHSVTENETYIASRFDRYSGQNDEQQTAQTEKAVNNVLLDNFGEDAKTKTTKSSAGLSLDPAQVDVLSSSWRCSDPTKLSSYRESYKQAFPIHENAVNLLQVPSLDDLTELLLVKKHGRKAAFGSSQSLYSQPMKAIEKLAFQGQLAARMGIISLCYGQQALVQLLNNLKQPQPNIDEAIQNVRDIFAISTKSLDQMARSGAFHHLVRRKATVADTGLQDYKDWQKTALSSSLSGESIFGENFEKKLKEKQEKDKQLADLMPDLTKKTAFKRKSFFSEASGHKKPRQDENTRPKSYSYQSYQSSAAKRPGGRDNNYRQQRANNTKHSQRSDDAAIFKR